MIPKIEEAFAELKKDYMLKYGFSVFDVLLEEKEEKLVLRGETLTEEQRDDALGAVMKLTGRKAEDKVRVLGSPKKKGATWAIVQPSLIDIKDRFVPRAVRTDRILKRIRCSQAAQGEILRVILEEDSQLLVQAEDLTIGWVDAEEVVRKRFLLGSGWRRDRVAEPDKLVRGRCGGQGIEEAAELYMNVPYSLGAKSRAAIDCSALVGVVYKDAAGVILPRHSWDQKKMGVEVRLEDAATGDLVFMESGEKDLRHVGIFERMETGGCIIHASLSAGMVVRERASDVLKRYKLAGVRRILE